MKNLQFKPFSMRGGAGRVGAKKFKHISISTRSAGLKSCPIPIPQPLRGGKNSHETKREETGQAGWDKIVIPTSITPRDNLLT